MSLRDRGYPYYQNEGGDYSYDLNGNITYDPSRGLTIAYNHLNLPGSMIFDSGDTILYTYDAAGRKWAQETRSAQGVLSLRQYIGSMEFEGTPALVSLKAVNHTEGRVVASNGGLEILIGSISSTTDYCADELQSTQDITSTGDVDYLALSGIKLKPGFSVTSGGSFAARWAASCIPVTWQWQYYLKDHLGNVRVVFSDEDGDGAIQNDSEILEENHFYPFGMQMDGPWVGSASAGNRYRYNGKEQIEDFDLGWYDYGARWYDASMGRFISVDPLADHPSLVGYSPYDYAVNNPILHTDPDGRCPPWICGAIAGGLVEAGAQYISNVAKGDSWLDAAKNIDGADVFAATVEGGITGGGSVARRLLVKGGAMVVSEVVQASVDIQLDGDIDIIGTEGSTKSVGQVATETTIGVGSNLVGEGLGGTLKAVTNSKATKQLSQVNRELRKSMQGSNGETVRLSKQANLSSNIKGNKVISEATGTVTTEVLDDKLKNN